MAVTHATNGSGTESGDGNVSKTAWEEPHDGTNDHAHTATGDGGDVSHDDLTGVSADDHHATDHDHDGSPTQQLAQANTHGTPDTDSATSSLHHTLGTGANQAAAGNDARLSDTRTPTAHDHAGTDITTSTVAAARLPALNSITAPTGDVSMNSHKITSVTDPGSNQDAATKKYVDDAVAAGVSFGTPANTYGTPAAGAASTAIRTDAVLPRPPGFELDYVEFTGAATNITATTEGTANTIVTGSAVAFDGTPVIIEFFAFAARPQATIAAIISYYLYEDGASIGRIGAHATPAAANAYIPTVCKRRMTPSAGSHTYSIRAATTSGTSVVLAGAAGNGTDMPGYIRITKA